jgi:hypothetical protein
MAPTPTPAPRVKKPLPIWRDDDEADEWLQTANLNEYEFTGTLLTDWLEQQEGPTLETLHSDLGHILKRLTELSVRVRSLEGTVRELSETQRRRRTFAARRAKGAVSKRTPPAHSKG